MHTVSPVRIRTDVNLSNPMTATNFEEHLNKKTKKKTVQIGSSTILNQKSSKNHQPKRVLSNKTSKPQQQAHQSNKSVKHDLPNETKLQKNLPGTQCTTCDEVRSRSRSKSNEKIHLMPLNTSTSSVSSSSSSPSDQHQHQQERTRPIDLDLVNDESARCHSMPYWSRHQRQRRGMSHSPRRDPHQQHHNCSIDPNSTYTMPLPTVNCCRSRSYDSGLLSRNGHKLHREDEPFVQLNPQSDLLNQKLIEIDSAANRIASQLSFLKDFAKHELLAMVHCSSQESKSMMVIAHLELERNRLLDQLDSFAMIYREFKAHLYEMNLNLASNGTNIHQENHCIDSFQKQIESLEAENQHYKAMISDFQSRANLPQSAEALNLENNTLNNIKQSLEDNRAHLRRQLIAREADINRLNVQLRNALRKFDRAQIEIDMLKENRQIHATTSSQQPDLKSSLISTGKIQKNNSDNSNSKLVKKYFNIDEILNDQVKTKQYIDKLNLQLIEKDSIIRDLTEQINNKNNQNQNAKQSNDSNEATVLTSLAFEQKSQRSERHEAERLRKENDKLKIQLQVKDEKLKKAEQKLKTSEIKSKNHSQLSQNTTSTTTTATGTTSSSSSVNNIIKHRQQPLPPNTASSLDDLSKVNTNPSADETIQRTKNFSEQELNNVRSRLQQRLNELEPLPELLKNTELKLHDALARLKTNETEINEYKRSIGDLKRELELNQANQDILVHKFKDALNIKSSHNKNNMSRMHEEKTLRQTESELKQNLIDSLATAKLEPIERRVRLIEEENRELHRQLAIKEDLIRELSNKLAIKTNDASSASRQLELAISDFNLKEQQLKEKYSSKERSLATKCVDLDTKISALQFQIQHDKREKEEQQQDYVMQIKDLKARLDQAQITNKQMQDYVNFLKNSYISYFNENTLHSFESSSNLIGSQNNLF